MNPWLATRALVALGIAMVWLAGSATAIYLLWPDTKFWVEVAVAVLAPIVAEIVRQIFDSDRDPR
jgi:hypothetical protein